MCTALKCINVWKVCVILSTDTTHQACKDSERVLNPSDVPNEVFISSEKHSNVHAFSKHIFIMYITCYVFTAENLEYPGKENKQVMNESQCQYVIILVCFVLWVGEMVEYVQYILIIYYGKIKEFFL